MAEIFDLEAGIHFGEADGPLPDWREDPELMAEEDPDDELLEETPADVVALLGFDPLEFE